MTREDAAPICQAFKELQQDNARLRGLIKEAQYACFDDEDISRRCPWCNTDDHQKSFCKVFKPNGEVK